MNNTRTTFITMTITKTHWNATATVITGTTHTYETTAATALNGEQDEYDDEHEDDNKDAEKHDD